MALLFFPAGKKGIASGKFPLDMIWKGKMSYWGGDGKRYSFQFCRVEDYEGMVHELDVSEVRGNYNSGCTALVLRSPKNIWKFVNAHSFSEAGTGTDPIRPAYPTRKAAGSWRSASGALIPARTFLAARKSPAPLSGAGRTASR